MTDRSLAHRYASALLQECGDSPDQLSEIARQLHVVAQTFSEPNSALRHLFLNPLFHVEQRLATLHRLQKNLNLHDILVRFMTVLVQRDRVKHLPEAAKAFAHLQRVREGVLSARVTSALPLSDKERQVLVNLLTDRFGKSVVLDCHQDSRVLGGIRLRVAGFVFDATLQGRVQALRTQLLGVN